MEIKSVRRILVPTQRNTLQQLCTLSRPPIGYNGTLSGRKTRQQQDVQLGQQQWTINYGHQKYSVKKK